MHPLLQRTLMAYRPLYLNGLLLDGQYKLPRTDPAADPTGGGRRDPRVCPDRVSASCWPR